MFKYFTFKNNFFLRLDVVAHAYNPSYSEVEARGEFEAYPGKKKW
jgi:hypothetical protein